MASVVAHSRVQGVSLTGSARAGAAVAELAGRHLKKVVLDLGGSDPFIVLEVDGLDAVVEAAVGGRLENTGQACNAAKRCRVAVWRRQGSGFGRELGRFGADEFVNKKLIRVGG